MGFVVGVVHLLVYGVMLRFFARACASVIFYLVWKPWIRFVLLALILLGLVVLALNPVYLPVTLHGEMWMNILRLALRFPFLK